MSDGAPVQAGAPSPPLRDPPLGLEITLTPRRIRVLPMGSHSALKLWDGTDFEHLRIPYHRPWERRPRPYPLVQNYHHSVVRQDSNEWILKMLPPASQEMADRITVHDTGGFMAWVYPRYNMGHELVLMPPSTHLRDHLGLRPAPPELLARRDRG